MISLLFRSPFATALCLLLVFKTAAFSADSVTIYGAPPGETPSQKFRVQAGGKEVPVYIAKVAPSDPKLRFKNVDDIAHSGEHYREAAFASFDLEGSTRVTVTCLEKVNTAQVLPSSSKIVPRIEGNTISFEAVGPCQLTLEVNGNWCESLHLFVNPVEVDIPKADDPNVVFYGPGIHEVDDVHIGSNKTVYIAGGAIVRGKPSSGKEKGATFILEGDHIVFRGRGILDGSLSPIHSRNLLFVRGNDIQLEGIILRDSSVWNIPIRQSKQVRVSNLKLLGYRANSDGIDICNSTDVTVSNCFLRTLDDLVVVKTDRGQGKAGNILVEKCVLWNEVAHALSVGAELREDIDGVVFRDCDVIHDKGREWTLRVFHCDSARICNVRFENIRVEESKKLISLWIDKANWSLDQQRGNIDDVIFSNIQSTGPSKIEFKGFDAAHSIRNVTLENMVIDGKALLPSDIITNPFVENIRILPTPPAEAGGIQIRNF